MQGSPVVPIRHRNSCSPAARYVVLIQAAIGWSSLLFAAPGSRASDVTPAMIVQPGTIRLVDGIHAQQVAATISPPDASPAAVTSTPRYAHQHESRASGAAPGLVPPVDDGEAVRTITHGD